MLHRAAEAEIFLREALAMRENRYAADHWRIADAESKLGACMSAMGRFTEGEPVLIACYERVKQQKGKEDRTTKACLDRIITLYESWDAAAPGNGYDAKAAEWRAKRPQKKDNETTEP